jgi:hypothetical protein
MIFKNILGVHSKASNLAIQTELGYYPRIYNTPEGNARDIEYIIPLLFVFLTINNFTCR